MRRSAFFPACTYLSAGSGTSSGSESDVQNLGLGTQRPSGISPRDVLIAKESLCLLVAILQLRPPLQGEFVGQFMTLQWRVIGLFFETTHAREFVLEVLVGSPDEDVRKCAVEQFRILSGNFFESLTKKSGKILQYSPRCLFSINSLVLFSTKEIFVQVISVPARSLDTMSETNAHQFLLWTLTRARLPFWVSSSSARAPNQRLMKQCRQYFDLRCVLSECLSERQQKLFDLNVPSLLADELTWLKNFVRTENDANQYVDDALIEGHLKLIRTYYTCCSVDKTDTGKIILQKFLL